jgi:hypothetical protein
MDREQRIALVNSLCEKAGCNEKVRKIHFHQLVDHNWHPHPPADFVTWWKSHPESKTTGAAKAFNCSCYVEQFNATT